MGFRSKGSNVHMGAKSRICSESVALAAVMAVMSLVAVMAVMALVAVMAVMALVAVMALADG